MDESELERARAGGPFLQAAAFCERVLQEQDGVSSLIRVIDRITHVASGPDAPEAMPPVSINLVAVIMLKAGSARGRHTVRLRVEAPSGEQEVIPTLELPVFFEGEDRGQNLVLNLAFLADQEGLYWFDVLFDDEPRPLTRMPLRVVYQPQRFGLESAAPGS